MELNEYQKIARTTAIYSNDHAIFYPALGLAGETGEVCEKIKKWVRDNTDTETLKQAIKKELGDVIWYIANLASDFDLTLNDIAQANIDKLLDRKSRGVLSGSGDNR